MFWKKARALYGHLTSEDDEIKKYIEISSGFQLESYGGIVGYIQDMGHRWVAENVRNGPTLEIGFGAGRHRLFYSGLVDEYFVSEYSPQHLQSDNWQKIRGRGVRCDARQLCYCQNSFKNVISIYNLEHIEDLEGVFREVHRVLQRNGHFFIVLPCEGGLLWNIGREFTTRRQFMKHYGLNYDKIIAYEHVWDYRGIEKKIRQTGFFNIIKRRMLPFIIPTHHINLIVCLECSSLK